MAGRRRLAVARAERRGFWGRLDESLASCWAALPASPSLCVTPFRQAARLPFTSVARPSRPRAQSDHGGGACSGRGGSAPVRGPASTPLSLPRTQPVARHRRLVAASRAPPVTAPPLHSARRLAPSCLHSCLHRRLSWPCASVRHKDSARAAAPKAAAAGRANLAASCRCSF
ncbi:MAG: hypothetical protein J3K34DRAFT_435670 [Monoraphidium minutum]|nr:MAG: hypothetical protein J3K34DRAFT_435670 [Monoraphidium minutum]